MRILPRVRRRADHWATPHARARSRAAEALARPLLPSEAAWLAEHLSECAACATHAAGYAADRQALRALRDRAPEPPRDLWARTAAAIEHESATRGGTAAISRRRRRWLPSGALAGLAVVGLVIGLSALSTGLLGVPGSIALAPVGPGVTAQGDGIDSAQIATPDATPILVRSGDVEWLDGSGARLAYRNASIDKVCPVDDTADCAPLVEASGRQVAIAAAPRTIIGSPTERNAVALSADGSGGDRLTVVTLPPIEVPDPTPAPTRTPPPSSQPSPAPASAVIASAMPTIEATPTPVTTQSPDPAASSTPVAFSPATTMPPPASPSPSPDESDAATATASPSPSSSLSASVEPSPSPSLVASPSPSPSLVAPPSPSLSPVVSPSPSPVVSPSDSASPAPTAVASLAIPSGLEVVGDTAAFSPDGQWFAFTARPSNGATGPDIYVWRVGQQAARRLTLDGQSVFGSWDADRIIGSRPTDSTGSTVTSFDIDPASGVASAAVRPFWRPVVDPTGARAVAWAGSVTAVPGRSGWQPAAGTLRLIPWGAAANGQASDGVLVPFETTGSPADFDVRWDETGEWFGIWVADPGDPTIGRLSLYRVDPRTGDLQVPDSAITQLAALPGFSIEHGRMAWATPPGQGGEGSRIQVVAWRGAEVGTVETAPGEDLVIVR